MSDLSPREREDLEALMGDLAPDLEPEDPIFRAGVALLADGFAALKEPAWLCAGALDPLCFKAHLGVRVGLFRVEDQA